MNEARLFVGVQGVAIGERAYQAALDYANERVQGRTTPELDSEAIIGHPDVRRTLLHMKTKLLGARAICLATAAAGDLAVHAEDETVRKAAHLREALLTPIAKAYGSDTGVEVASMGVQIHGGMGYVEETGAAQHYRDARIAPIYEGTNGIQAIDLVTRKVRRDGGEAMFALIDELSEILTLCEKSVAEQGEEQPKSGPTFCVGSLSDGIETIRKATNIIINSTEKEALAAATPYLTLCAEIIADAFLIKAACNGYFARDDNYKDMEYLASFHSRHVAPMADARLVYLWNPSEEIMLFPMEQLADL
jgi:hypothetical protein